MRSFKTSHLFLYLLSLAVMASAVLWAPGTALASADDGTAAALEAIRLKHGLPALASAVVGSGGLESSAAVGERKAGTGIPVTIDDQWHLGSDTKAMTAVLIGTLVEEGRLRWDSSLREVFPELAKDMKEENGGITLLELLSHRSGLVANLPWGLLKLKGDIREQRLAAVRAAASSKLQSAPGTAYLYSNAGYTIAGAMAEKVTGRSWEELIRERIFKPLGMTTAGFGGLGTPGVVDEPWPHDGKGSPLPQNGPMMDNPEVMGPAGTVHCSLGDWARFVADFLRGQRGARGLLKPETCRFLTVPPFGGNYALGWLVVDLPGDGGRMMAHDGSNNMNYATVRVFPTAGFAVLVVTNQGGDAAQKACQEAAEFLTGRRSGKSAAEK